MEKDGVWAGAGAREGAYCGDVAGLEVGPWAREGAIYEEVANAFAALDCYRDFYGDTVAGMDNTTCTGGAAASLLLVMYIMPQL